MTEPIDGPMQAVSTAPPPVATIMSPVMRPSTVDLITVKLRNAIYSGLLGAGASIREVEVAQQLRVSRGPLREAAQRLVQEGLLVAIPGRGLNVVTIGLDQVPDLYAARVAVETHAARLLVRSGPDTAFAPIKEALERLAEASTTRDARRIGDADLNFHWALVSASGNEYLRRYMSTLIVHVRIASLAGHQEYTVRTDAAQTHAALLDLLVSRDELGIVEALTDHLDAAAARLVSPRPSDETIGEQPPLTEKIRLDPIDPAGS